MQTVEPFTMNLLYPAWRALRSPGKKVEQCTHADKKLGIERAHVFTYPFLLNWITHRNKYDFRSRPVDFIAQRRCRNFRVPVQTSGNLMPKLLLNDDTSFLCNTRLPAKEKDFASNITTLEEIRQKIGAIQILPISMAVNSQGGDVQANAIIHNDDILATKPGTNCNALHNEVGISKQQHGLLRCSQPGL